MGVVTMCTTCQVPCKAGKCCFQSLPCLTNLIATCAAHINTSKPCELLKTTFPCFFMLSLLFVLPLHVLRKQKDQNGMAKWSTKTNQRQISLVGPTQATVAHKRKREGFFTSLHVCA
jgi:hypothetical protein